MSRTWTTSNGLFSRTTCRPRAVLATPDHSARAPELPVDAEAVTTRRRAAARRVRSVRTTSASLASYLLHFPFQRERYLPRVPKPVTVDPSRSKGAGLMEGTRLLGGTGAVALGLFRRRLRYLSRKRRDHLYQTSLSTRTTTLRRPGWGSGPTPGRGRGRLWETNQSSGSRLRWGLGVVDVGGSRDLARRTQPFQVPRVFPVSTSTRPDPPSVPRRSERLQPTSRPRW